jgi:hypothetical protein
MFIPFSPPPRQEGMSAKFHHSTILRTFKLFGGSGLFQPGQRRSRDRSGSTADWLVETKLTKCPIFSQFLKENFCVFKNI